MCKIIGTVDKNLEYIKKARKVYFVAMKEELDAECTSSEVVYTGVGKARATRGLLRWIQAHTDELERGVLPLVISLGTAGSGRHERGSIVLAEDFVNNGDVFIRERLHFDVLPEPTGHVCASSDFFVSQHNFSEDHVRKMREEYDCLDMESFALANVCSVYGLGFMAIKCISDGADDTVESFDEMLPRFRAKLNALVSQLD